MKPDSIGVTSVATPAGEWRHAFLWTLAVAAVIAIAIAVVAVITTGNESAVSESSFSIEGAADSRALNAPAFSAEDGVATFSLDGVLASRAVNAVAAPGNTFLKSIGDARALNTVEATTTSPLVKGIEQLRALNRPAAITTSPLVKGIEQLRALNRPTTGPAMDQAAAADVKPQRLGEGGAFYPPGR
jgi:hypothetical protein